MACALAAVGGADAAAAPKALRAAILKTELAQRSVHYVTNTSRPAANILADVRARDVADVARNRGIQRWKVFWYGGRTGHLTIRLVHSTLYFRGDAIGVLWIGLAPSSYAGRWFSVPHNSPGYANAARNLTIGSFARDSVPENHLSLVRDAVGGRPMRGLRGAAPEGGVLTTYVPESGPSLPAEAIEVEHGAQFGIGHTTLSNWNEPVHVKTPAHSVPIH
jgi:hypothetical protein